MDSELSTKLGELQATNNKQILDSLMNCLNEFNAGKKYDYIFNAANILIGDEGDNITATILKTMNEKYAAKAVK
jgi:outer membrane protein